MCGIAGLFIKDRQLQTDLGGMLDGHDFHPLCSRGPDFGRICDLFGEGSSGTVQIDVRIPDAAVDSEALIGRDGFGSRRWMSMFLAATPTPCQRA